MEMLEEDECCEGVSIVCVDRVMCERVVVIGVVCVIGVIGYLPLLPIGESREGSVRSTHITFCR